ncbi:hypothetical protein MUK42_26951, partial [Musa troglodytarum]
NVRVDGDVLRDGLRAQGPQPTGLGRTVDYVLKKGTRGACPLADISRDLDIALKCPREKSVPWTATQAADRAVTGREPFVSIQFRKVSSMHKYLVNLAFLGVGGPYSMGRSTPYHSRAASLSLSLSLSRSSSCPLRRIGYCPLTPRWISDRFFVGRTGTRSQNTVFLASPSKKQQSGFNEPGSWTTIFERHSYFGSHRFMLRNVRSRESSLPGQIFIAQGEIEILLTSKKKKRIFM